MDFSSVTDPLELAMTWIAEARESGVTLPEAVTLASVDEQGAPDARVVLLKARRGLDLHFFTNYNSQKAQQLAADPRACMVLHHHVAERQVRVRGRCTRLSAKDSESYFRTRPRESQIGAWASAQSEVLASADVLKERVSSFTSQFAGKEVPRPPHWGGIALRAESVEIWLGQSGRLHERAIFRRDENVGSPRWSFELLNP